MSVGIERVVGVGAGMVALAGYRSCRIEERAVVALSRIGAQTSAIVASYTQITIRDRGDAAVAGACVGLVFCDEHLRDGEVGGFFGTTAYLREGLYVAACAGFAAGFPSGFAVGCFDAACEADLVEGFHLIFAAAFFVVYRFWQLDYVVHARAFALSTQDPLVFARRVGVRRQCHDAAHRGVSVHASRGAVPVLSFWVCACCSAHLTALS
jgi:hypothetical protein